MKFAVSRFGAACICAMVVVVSAVAPLSAQTASAISGLVVDQHSALPVSGATVSVSQAGTVVSTATTDSAGRYSVSLAPGLFTVSIRANGFIGSDTADVTVSSGVTSTVNASLAASTTSQAASVSTIGRTQSTRNPLQSATTITQSVTPEELTQTGQLRVGQQLGTLPGVNFATSSAVGDDSSINLRGFGSTETSTLLDGHPVGPLGVFVGNAGFQYNANFNYALWPSYGFSSIDVTYGSGAQGLFGSDTIGGAVNFVTIGPTRKPQFQVQQQVGGFGQLATTFTATGTSGKIGYVVGAGVLGSYGDFFPGTLIAQSARPNNVAPFPGPPYSVNPNGLCDQYSNDVSACNLALNTYAVSQNNKLTTLLGKLAFQFSPVTSLNMSFFDAVHWADSTGNGDNDNLPYSTRLNQIGNKTSNCTTSGGVAGYTVYTDPIAGATTCYTAQQYAQATFGPDGGGAGRQRSTRMLDYNFRFNTAIGNNNIAANYFYNFYTYWKDSSIAGGLDANGNPLGTPVYANFFNTQGLLVSDEIVSGSNDLTFGYTLYHQLVTGTQLTSITTGFQTIPTQYPGEWSYFLRDSYQFTNQLALFANLWEKHSSVTGLSTFDPRLTFQVRPTNHDVFQLTYGRSDGAPSPILKQTGVPTVVDPGSSLTSLTCPQNGVIVPNSVVGSGNPTLRSESANDFEAGYGHRFYADTNVQINAYVTSVKNQLLSATVPLSTFGANNVIFPAPALATYIGKLDSQCGLALSPTDLAGATPYLGVSTTFNIASALARGLEFSARARLTPWAYIDGKYSIESSTQTVPDSILINNPTLINGGQIAGIPLQQATLSFDAAPGPWEVRVDNYYIGYNNTYNRPHFWYTNAFLSRSFNHGNSLLSVGGTNIFNQAAQDYGYIGYGTAYPTNALSGVSPTASEEYGLSPAQLTLTFQQRF